jgi:hypothetical protein
LGVIWGGVRVYPADGTETGQSLGVVLNTFGDGVVPDADIPALITALQDYVARSTARAVMTEVVRALEDPRGTDTVGHDALYAIGAIVAPMAGVSFDSYVAPGDDPDDEED